MINFFAAPCKVAQNNFSWLQNKAMIPQQNGDVSTDTLRNRQVAALKQLLNLNQPLSQSLAVEPVWKLLVLDKYGQDIISPLIPVKQLRELGVTLHLLLNAKRETLPDVPAVYFVSPTDDNVRLICEDLRRAMYDSFYLNMIFPIQRPQLEELASSSVYGNSTQLVQKASSALFPSLTDQYLSFIALEDSLFALRRYSQDSPISFYAINNPTITQDEMEGLIESIANGLFSVCVTLGVVPIIKCPKGNAAEQVALKLDQKIRDNLRDARNNLFTQDTIRAGQWSVHRPVLVIADRNLDFTTMLHHTWTYQAMIHDVLDFELNRIKMVDPEGRNKEYDIEQSDKLWTNFKGSPFPLVAEAIQDGLDTCRKNEDEIKTLKHTMGIENADDEAAIMMVDDATSKLQTAMGSLPELLEQKRLIGQHTNVATTLLNNIKQRQLDVLFESEEKLLNGQVLDPPFQDLFKSLANNGDALRLLLIHFFSANQLTSTDKRELFKLLQERDIDPAALKFVERLRSVTNVNRSVEVHQGGGTKTVSMFSKLLNHSSKFVMEGVKNLVPKKHNLPVTNMVDQLVDTRQSVTTGLSGPSFDVNDYVFFDPKLMHSSTKDLMNARQGQLAQDVIVFVVGGGNYIEYQNVLDYAKTKGLQRITYGATEMVNPQQFVEQLARLGRKL
ncbi:Suppressor of ypt1 [Aphelenchoides bicaudatus]|nr:Suppressor of ypt1 [Aphelenchoides bicaudatus]